MRQRKSAYAVRPLPLSEDEQKRFDEATRHTALSIMELVQVSACTGSRIVQAIEFYLGHRNTPETSEHLGRLRHAFDQLVRDKAPIPPPEE